MIVFLPGLICDARTFAPQCAAFGDSLAVDGYPDIDRLEDMASHVLETVPGRFDLFGHSMGARVALEIMHQAPERVTRLALASTGVHPVKEGEADKRHALQQIGYDQGFGALVDAWLPPMVAERNRTPELMSTLRAMCMDQGQDSFDNHISALLNRKDRREMLKSITCPTLVLTGEEDGWSPPAQLREIAGAIPGAEYATVPEAGHMVTVERPDPVNALISKWLDIPAE